MDLFELVLLAVLVAFFSYLFPHLVPQDQPGLLLAWLRNRVWPAPPLPPPVDPRKDTTLATPWRTISREPIKELKENRRGKLSKNPSTINVQLCGLVGSGKSSFINTAMTASCDTDEICTPAPTRRSDMSVTHENTMVSLNDCNINLRDFPGISLSATEQQRDDFMKNLETAIIGWMPDNQKVDGKVITEHRKIKEDLTVVVIVINGSEWSSLSDDNRRLLSKIVTMCNKHNFNPLIVLTSIDSYSYIVQNEESEDINLENLLKSEKVKKLVKEVHNCIGVPENLIAPVVNYTSQAMPYPNIDTLMLHTLTMIIQRHKDFCDFQKNRKEYKDTAELTCMMD